MKNTSKNKIKNYMYVGNMVYFVGKLTNMNFDIFCKISLCHGKTAITFAYDVV